MIITKEVEINIRSNNIKLYLDKSYSCRVGDILLVSIENLPLSSHSKIECVCQNCKNIKTLGYHNYNKNIKNGGIFYCRDCKNIKTQKTNMKRYGVKSVLSNSIIKEKIKKTLLEKYGVEHPYQSDEINKKISISLKKTYRESGKEILEKKIKNSLIKHGCEFPQSLKDTKDRVKSTFLEKFGFENCFQSEIIKDKMKNTCLEKYGVDNFVKTDEYKKHMKCLEIDYQSIQEKLKNTCLEKYGVEYPAQNIDIFNKTQKTQLKIKFYKDIKYQGTYELDFLIFCENIGIINEISKVKSIKYRHEDKIKFYHPDFYVKKLNLIIEIKSDYYYNLYLEKNQNKRNGCLDQKYDFIFIINKNYEEFLEKIKAIK